MRAFNPSMSRIAPSTPLKLNFIDDAAFSEASSFWSGVRTLLKARSASFIAPVMLPCTSPANFLTVPAAEFSLLVKSAVLAVTTADILPRYFAIKSSLIQLHQLGNHLMVRLPWLVCCRDKRTLVRNISTLVVPAGTHNHPANPRCLLPCVWERPTLIVCTPLGQFAGIYFVQQLLYCLAQAQS